MWVLITVLADSHYANEPVMHMCRELGWEYLPDIGLDSYDRLFPNQETNAWGNRS